MHTVITPAYVEEPVAEESGPLRAKAEAWMSDNPDGYRMFESLALEAAARGQRFGINQLREVYRWNTPTDKQVDGRFKFCNSYSPYVARRLIETHPHLSKFMKCRRTKDEGINECQL